MAYDRSIRSVGAMIETFAVDALTYSNGKLRRPVPVRDHRGRLQRAPGGEWDWFYDLPAGERRYVSERFMSPDGALPEHVATFHAMSIDGAMGTWLEYVRLARSRATVFGDDYDQAAGDPLDELVGPAEVADLLGVKVNTVAQWRLRHDDFPQPVLMLSGTRIWHRDDIERWADLHQRNLA